jgi:hypothetical protein
MSRVVIARIKPIHRNLLVAFLTNNRQTQSRCIPAADLIYTEFSIDKMIESAGQTLSLWAES